MASTGELIGLLRRIRGASSSMEKLKLAALAWRTLRGLPPGDRVQVARELGLEGAERIVEGLSQRGGLSPTALLTAIHRAEQADPEQLEALVESFKDPAQRAKALEHAVEAADDYLAEELAAAGADVFVAEENAKEDEKEEGAEESAEAAPPALPVKPSPAESFPDSPPPEPAPPEQPAPRPPAPPQRHSALPPAKRSRPSPEAASISDRVASRTTPLGRLRCLDSALGQNPHLTAADCRRTLENFPPGWTRRRALERLLQSGHPPRIDEALALIDALARPGDRLWALTVLADRKGLSGADTLRIVDAAAEPALQRRLRARLENKR